MKKIEDKIKKEIERKNINNKSYFWILAILIFTVIVVVYSYQTDTGIIARQTIDKDLIVKNQENLRLLYIENKLLQKEPINNSSLVDEPIIVKVEGKVILAQETEQEKPLIQEKILVKQENLTQEMLKNDSPEVKVSVSKKIIPKKEPIIAKVEKKQILTDEINKFIEPKTNFNLITCYSFEPAKSFLVKNCEDKLNDFINNNSNSTQYEIIGLIDLKDVRYLSNKGEINQKLLAKNRIMSVQKILKTKTNIPISKHFYYLKSEMETRGFALRAYF